MSSDPYKYNLSHSVRNGSFGMNFGDRMRARARTDSGTGFARLKYVYYQAIIQTVEAVVSFIDENDTEGADNDAAIREELKAAQLKIEEIEKKYFSRNLTIEGLVAEGCKLEEPTQSNLFDFSYGEALTKQAEEKKGLLLKLTIRYADHTATPTTVITDDFDQEDSDEGMFGMDLS